jgi:glycosyltransferase involved in cell wall biosynthesis
VSGLLVGAPHPELLAKAVLRILDNPAQAGAMGEAGRKRVIERFNITRTASQMRAVYQTAIKDFELERLAHTDQT